MGNWNGLPKLSMLCQIGLLDTLSQLVIGCWLSTEKCDQGQDSFLLLNYSWRGCGPTKLPETGKVCPILKGNVGGTIPHEHAAPQRTYQRGNSHMILYLLHISPYQGYKTVENERLWVPCSITDTVNFCSHPHGQSICRDMSQQVSLMASVGNLNSEWLGKCFPVMGWL